MQDQEIIEVSPQRQIIPKLSLDESYDLFLNFKEKNGISPKIFKKISCKHCKRLEANSPRSIDTKKATSVTSENETRTKPVNNIKHLIKSNSNCLQDDMVENRGETQTNILYRSESDEESINLILELDDSVESFENSKNIHLDLDDLIYNIIGKLFF